MARKRSSRGSQDPLAQGDREVRPLATTEYAGTHGVVLFDETVFGNDDDAAKLAGSDHRPVWIELSVTKDDD